MRLPTDPNELRVLAARHGRMPYQEAVVVLAARVELYRRERGAAPALLADATVEMPEATQAILAEAEAAVDAASSQEQPVVTPVPIAGERDPLAELDEVLGGPVPPPVIDPLA